MSEEQIRCSDVADRLGEFFAVTERVALVKSCGRQAWVRI